ncbi:hypothetical protein GmHk_14G042185 [Glycine max]|nr:hypothetical protein GmHk_14G042185 [Glycine max]
MQALPPYIFSSSQTFKHEIFLVSSSPVLPGYASHQSLCCSQELIWHYLTNSKTKIGAPAPPSSGDPHTETLRPPPRKVSGSWP